MCFVVIVCSIIFLNKLGSLEILVDFSDFYSDRTFYLELLLFFWTLELINE